MAVHTNVFSLMLTAFTRGGVKKAAKARQESYCSSEMSQQTQRESRSFTRGTLIVLVVLIIVLKKKQQLSLGGFTSGIVDKSSLVIFIGWCLHEVGLEDCNAKQVK